MFDAAKKHFCILHKLNCSGATFRLLGVLVNPKLSMTEEIDHICNKARPKIRAILNTRSYYDTGGLLQQYKVHVLCLLGQSALAIYNAAQSYLDSLNRVQRSFIQELGLTEEEAFLKFQLVPLDASSGYCSIGLSSQNPIGRSASGLRFVVSQSCACRATRYSTWFTEAQAPIRRDKWKQLLL